MTNDIEPTLIEIDKMPLQHEGYAQVVDKVVRQRAGEWNRDCVTRYEKTLYPSQKDLESSFRDTFQRNPSIDEIAYMKKIIPENKILAPLLRDEDTGKVWDPNEEMKKLGLL